MTKFSSRHFSLVYVPRDLSVSNKIHEESFLSKNNALTKNDLFDADLNSSLVGFFFVSGPLRGLKSVSRVFFGHTVNSIKIF